MLSKRRVPWAETQMSDCATLGHRDRSKMWGYIYANSSVAETQQRAWSESTLACLLDPEDVEPEDCRLMEWARLKMGFEVLVGCSCDSHKRLNT